MGPRACFYVRLQVHGELGPTWSAAFGNLTVEPRADGTTLIRGELPDQTAFHGLLAAIRDLGLSLISVETFTTPRAESQTGAMR